MAFDCRRHFSGVGGCPTMQPARSQERALTASRRDASQGDIDARPITGRAHGQTPASHRSIRLPDWLRHGAHWFKPSRRADLPTADLPFLSICRFLTVHSQGGIVETFWIGRTWPKRRPPTLGWRWESRRCHGDGIRPPSWSVVGSVVAEASPSPGPQSFDERHLLGARDSPARGRRPHERWSGWLEWSWHR